VPPGTEVATLRTQTADAITFVTVQPADALPTSLAHTQTGPSEGDLIERDNDLAARRRFPAFADAPTPGDCLYVGLDQAAPWCVVNLRFGCSVSGVGVNPDDPPLVWEARLGDGRWARCDVDRDGTGGFNQSGDVVVHVPAGHTTTVVGRRSAGWLRCRLAPAEENQPTYTEPPLVESLEVFTVGVDCPALNAELVEGQEVGVSDGAPGQRFRLPHAPLVPTSEPLVVEVAEQPADPEGGWVEWQEVDGFAGSEPDDRHVAVDLADGEVYFGPAVRLKDGTLRQHGKIPPTGAHIRLRWYWHGGGGRGNVATDSLVVLKTAVPLIRAVTNRRPAFGGVDPETVEEAKARGPIELRTIDRAVTAEDYALLVRREAPEVARVKCLTVEDHGEPGAVRVLLVPHVPEGGPDGAVPFRLLQISDDIRERVRQDLDRRRVVSTRLAVDEPVYRWVTVVAKVRAARGHDHQSLEQALIRAVHRYLHPVFGGPEGRGWPFGRPLHMGEVHAALQRVPGVEYVEQVRLFAVDPATQRPTEELSRLVLQPNELVYSYRHDILVEEA
jgi:predicted phage baseplate assembly protein